MKKIFGFCALLALYILLCLPQVFAQNSEVKTDVEKFKKWNVGAKVGYHLAAFRGPEVKNANVQIGFMGGIHGRYNISPRFSIQAEVLYEKKSASALYEEITQQDSVIFGKLDTFTVNVRNDAKLEFQYLTVPVLGKFNFINQKALKAFITTGVSVSYVMTYKTTGYTDVYISDVNVLDDLVFQGQKSKILVASGEIKPDFLKFNRFDWGLVFGGGTIYNIGYGNLTFDLRFTLGMQDIDPTELNLKSGGFMCAFGYEF